MRSSGHRRPRLATALTAALCPLATLALAGTLTAATGTAPAAAATRCAAATASDPGVPGDVDGDGVPDPVVGVPTESNWQHDGGGIDLFRSRIGAFRIDGDQFQEEGFTAGTSVAVAPLDGDRCSEVIIGAPGVAGHSGEVFIIAGSSTRRLTYDDLVGRFDGSTVEDDGFGTAVVAAPHPGTEPLLDIWVGAPKATVDGIRDAGAVEHIVLGPDGSSLTDRITLDSLGLRAASGDRFGSVLSALAGGVAVGIPHRTVSGHRDAGSIVLVAQTAPAAYRGVEISQQTAGVPGGAETGDAFGAALSTAGDVLAVGVPGEDLGRAVDAGAVQPFAVTTKGLVAGLFLAQGSAGLPGRPETGDRFGASVAVVDGDRCPEIAAGAPGEDLGAVRDAGSVTLVPGTVRCGRPVALFQGHGMRGRPERGDTLGASLALLPGVRTTATVSRSSLLVGVPGENGRSGVVQSVGLHTLAPDRPDLVRIPVGISGAKSPFAFGSVLATVG